MVNMTDEQPEIRSGLPRWVDGLMGSIGFVVTLPIMAVAALFVKLGSAGPVLFRQERVGRNGVTFTMYKLRTMHPESPGPGVTAADDDRITPTGRWLRRFKLDELPELWNVVRGDMALVGPRPEIPELVDLADPVWQAVLRARPGLTDPVTLSLRNEGALLAEVEGDREAYYRRDLQPRKLRGYLDYLDRRSWLSDLRVLAATASALLTPTPRTRLHE